MSSDVNILRIATRQSQLALWQAEHVRDRLQQAHPGLQVELVKMTTQGDRILDTPLAKIGGKGLFVKELETGLLEGTADIAVHSMKDVPVELPEGLHLQVILRREDPRDAFVSNLYENLDSLPEQAVVGTSSLRRQSQLKQWRPDLDIRTLRGNVNTRLDKLDRNEYEAIILASAGLKRLGMETRIREFIATERILPAIGQGAIGIETRVDDERVNSLIQPLHDESTAVCVRAERAFNATLQGGCQVPIGGFAELHNGNLGMRGLVAEVDGSLIISGQQEGSPDDAEQIGEVLARDLLARGADHILQALYNNE